MLHFVEGSEWCEGKESYSNRWNLANNIEVQGDQIVG